MGRLQDQKVLVSKFLSDLGGTRRRIAGFLSKIKKKKPLSPKAPASPVKVLNGKNVKSALPVSTHWTDQTRRVLSRLLSNIPSGGVLEWLQNLNLRMKIILVLILLFISITFLGIVGNHYVQSTSNNSVVMMRDNYKSIEYTTVMMLAINDVLGIITMKDAADNFRRQELRKAFDKFEIYLRLQTQKSSGKPEEKELTDQLRESYLAFKNYVLQLQSKDGAPMDIHMQRDYLLSRLTSIQELNGKIIDGRVKGASNMANKVTKYMIFSGCIFVIFCMLALFYFPNYIAEPIQNLTESIKQIAQKNYSQRVEVKRNDEIGELARTFNMMAEKLEEYESINVAQIVTEKKRTETIVSRMNEAIIGLDDQKTILFANPPALELIGMNEQDLIGKSAAVSSKKNEMLQTLLKEILNDEVKDSKTFPTVSIDKNGKRQYFNKDVLKIESQSDDSLSPTNVGFVVILKNVTELKEQDLAKTNFMATLSHELKTPISAIDMSLNLMKDKRIGRLNDDQQDLAKTISQNTSRLLRMVNEILDISRIETGKLQLHMEDVPPDEVVVRALDNVKTFIHDKKIEVFQYIEPDLPLLRIDMHKTTAVLVNFLTNAIRYSPPKDSVEIVVVRQDGTVEFSVKDHGAGISEEEQIKLFQPYRRAHGDKTKGTGLGLAISKEFVEAQGGKIWVVSKAGAGSTFGFVLPVG